MHLRKIIDHVTAIIRIFLMGMGIIFCCMIAGIYTVYSVGTHIAETAQKSSDPAFIPRESDIIVTFAGNILRDYYATELQKKSGCHWIISDPLDSVYKHIKYEVLDSSAITPFYSGTSTISEIKAIDSVLSVIYPKRANRFEKQRIIIISTPSHLARIERMAERHFSIDAEYKYLGVPHKWMSYPPQYYTEWWKQPEIQSEIKKYIGYWLLYWF